MNSTRPLVIDLYCGLGGWAEGFLAEGYDCIGVDIERHDYGTGSYPGQLVLQDALTLHGSQFKDASVIVASPPCQKYSYMAMPWSRAKSMAANYRANPELIQSELNALFDACFRIQREAIEAAGRYIPLIVENVRGARPWVGEATWSFGSFYLWGDVPALMPRPIRAVKVPSFRFDGSGKSFQTASVRRTDPGKGARFTSRDCGDEGLNFGGGWWHDSTNNLIRKASSKSPARKAASAQIAKIPFTLARYIAQVYKPATEAVA